MNGQSDCVCVDNIMIGSYVIYSCSVSTCAVFFCFVCLQWDRTILNIIIVIVLTMMCTDGEDCGNMCASIHTFLLVVIVCVKIFTHVYIRIVLCIIIIAIFNIIIYQCRF